MSTKMTPKEFSEQELKEEINEIKSSKNKEGRDQRVAEITRHFASRNQWDQAIDAFQLISNEKERNLLIADLIEGSLLPAHNIDQAKKIAKYLTPMVEMDSFVWLRIALADNDTAEAQKIAERLPSPLSRNFAFMHILETYLNRKEKNKMGELLKLITENVRTIYDSKSRSYILRDLAVNLFMHHSEQDKAKEIALLIPDETIRNQVLNKINASKSVG